MSKTERIQNTDGFKATYTLGDDLETIFISFISLLKSQHKETITNKAITWEDYNAMNNKKKNQFCSEKTFNRNGTRKLGNFEIILIILIWVLTQVLDGILNQKSKL